MFKKLRRLSLKKLAVDLQLDPGSRSNAASREAPDNRAGDDLDRETEAWSRNPGADLVPGPADSPHGFGGDLWRTSPCKGCGHPIRVWFTLDLGAIPELQPSLPGWRFFPLLGCADCMVWMGRHDYRVYPDRREVELLSVEISTDEYGEAFDTTLPIPLQPAALRWREPGGDPDDFETTLQVGGVPIWTQDEERVFCPSCRNEMNFVASMATPDGFDPPVVINNESGLQYHFACATCRHLCVIAQWT